MGLRVVIIWGQYTGHNAFGVIFVDRTIFALGALDAPATGGRGVAGARGALATGTVDARPRLTVGD